MVSLIPKLLVAAARIIYFPIKLFPKRNKVTFISRQSNTVSEDMRLLCEYISENSEGVEVKAMAKKIEKSAVGLISYGFHMISQMYNIATSKAVVVDGYCICVSALDHRRGTTFIQMWHALGAVKKFGYQSLDKPSGSSSVLASAMKMHRNYDWFIAASEKTAEHFAEAFNTDVGKAKLLGLPRIDVLLRDDEEKSFKIRERYGLKDDRGVILYVPTFRKGKKLPIEEMLRCFDMKDFVLVIKLHPLDETTVSPVHADNVIFDREFGTYDWARMSDKIITDYSAFALEGTLLEKPMYFFLYDFEEYERDPGVNIDIRGEMGKYAVTDAVSLFGIMKEEYDFRLLESFRNRYITVDTKDCTARLAEFIVSTMR